MQIGMAELDILARSVNFWLGPFSFRRELIACRCNPENRTNVMAITAIGYEPI